MDNLIPQYEPNNEVFKQIVFCALCLSAGIFYFLFKLFSHGSLEWFDGLVLSAVGAGAGFFYRKAQQYEKDKGEEL